MSLAHEDDFPPFRKRFAFEVLMGFASGPFSDRGILAEVVALLGRASRFDTFAYELVCKRNVLSWLAGLAAAPFPPLLVQSL